MSVPLSIGTDAISTTSSTRSPSTSTRAGVERTGLVGAAAVTMRMVAMRAPRQGRHRRCIGTMPIAMTPTLERLSIDTIRTLSMDAVQKANSGHPGAPMGAAPMAFVLWTRFLRHAPTRPDWPDRDRFVLSAGHASMLLYSLLHLTGYDLALEDLTAFRQWGSRTPGHPEHGLTPGVEATTGPLGQGFANAVGMAIAERRLAARVQPAGPHRDRPPHLRHRLRRRPPGGHHRGGREPRRAPSPRQARSSSTTTTTSSSTAPRRWPGPRTSSSASRRMAGALGGWRTATTRMRSRRRSRRPARMIARR